MHPGPTVGALRPRRIRAGLLSLQAGDRTPAWRASGASWIRRQRCAGPQRRTICRRASVTSATARGRSHCLLRPRRLECAAPRRACLRRGSRCRGEYRVRACRAGDPRRRREPSGSSFQEHACSRLGPARRRPGSTRPRPGSVPPCWEAQAPRVGAGPLLEGSLIGTEIPTLPSTAAAAFWAGSGNAPAEASPPTRGSAQATMAVADSTATRGERRREGRIERAVRSSTTAAAICSTASGSPTNSQLLGASRSARKVRATAPYRGGAPAMSTAPDMSRSAASGSSANRDISLEKPSRRVIPLHLGGRPLSG